MATSKPTQDETAKIIAGVITFGLLLWVFFSCFDVEPVTSTNDKKQFSAFEAVTASQFFVEKKLKAPATAKFDFSVRDSKQINDTVFLVTSFVDSENEFGALLRIDYSCIITFSNDSIQCKDLVLEQR